jgi:hypothetical protein
LILRAESPIQQVACLRLEAKKSANYLLRIACHSYSASGFGIPSMRRSFIILTLCAALAGAAVLTWRPWHHANVADATPAPPTPPEAEPGRRTFSPAIMAALTGITSWTLYSLRDSPYKAGYEEVCGHPTFGKTTLQDHNAAVSAIQEINEAAGRWNGGVATCFEPHHALAGLLPDGRRLEFIICYLCTRAELWVDGTVQDTVHFSCDGKQPRKEPLNDLLKASGIPLSPHAE